MLKKRGIQSFYLASPLGILVLIALFLTFKVKSVFYGVEVFLLLNYAYVYLPIVLYLLRSAAIKKKLVPLQIVPRNYKYFVILVPAKNEALALPSLLISVNNQDYPEGMYKVVVVADNCTDNTSVVAWEYGAECIEKNSVDEHPGKGACLAYACEVLAAQGLPVDTYFVISDADCELEPNFLTEVNKKLNEPDAAVVLQSYRYVMNAEASVVASLDAASETIRQMVMLGNRDLLGLNAFLHGSGTIYEKSVFFAIASRGDTSATEDKEWNAWLLEQKIPIKWCPSARLGYRVYEKNEEFQMQRVRWVRGQFISARKFAGKALLHGIFKGDLSQIDYACGLYQLPRSILIFMSLLCGLVNFFYFESTGRAYAWLIFSASSLPYEMLALRISHVQYTYKGLFATGFKMAWGVARSSMLNSIGTKANKWWSDRRGIYNNSAK